MNGLENNAATAALNRLKANVALMAIPMPTGTGTLVPVLWDEDAETTNPRLTVRATQGAEEVWNEGVYQVHFDVTFVCEAKHNKLREVSGCVEKELVYNANIHAAFADGGITDAHFYCFGRIGSGSSAENNGGNRVFRAQLTVIGFDLDRFS